MYEGCLAARRLTDPHRSGHANASVVFHVTRVEEQRIERFVLQKRERIYDSTRVRMWKHAKLFCRGGCARVRGRGVFSDSKKAARASSKFTDVVSEEAEYALPKETRVVICGGGVMGGAVAYHLSLMGLGPETVILESGRYVFLFL